MCGGVTLVLLDLDGTLVDSLPGITAAMNATLGTTYSEDEVRPRIGPPLQVTLGTLTGETGARLDAIVTAYRATYAQVMLDGTVVYDGIPELLEGLTDAGLTLAVATSKARHLAVALLDGLGLSPFFAAIEGPVPPAHDDKATTIGRALRAVGATASPAVTMVGDRHHDIDGARTHGLRAIGVLWGFGSRDELAGAGVVAATPQELRSLLLPEAHVD